MTRTEAMALLGVTDETPTTEIRRAYLRAIKHTTAERDPEGFQQLRAAYEMLCLRSAVSAVVPMPLRSTTSHAPPRTIAPAVEAVDVPSDAVQGGDASAGSSIPEHVDPRRALEIVLELHRDARPEHASQLFARWYQRLHHVGRATELDDGDRAMLVATHELCRCVDLPPPIRTLVARGVLGGDAERIADELRQHVRARPFSATRAVACFSAHAPSLDVTYGNIIRAAGPQLRRDRERNRRGFVLWLGFASLAVGFHLLRDCDILGRGSDDARAIRLLEERRR